MIAILRLPHEMISPLRMANEISSYQYSRRSSQIEDESDIRGHPCSLLQHQCWYAVIILMVIFLTQDYMGTKHAK